MGFFFFFFFLSFHCEFIILRFYLWEFSAIRVEGGFPKRGIAFASPRWMESSPTLRIPENSAVNLRCFGAQVISATHLYKAWFVVLNSWRFRNLLSSLSTEIWGRQLSLSSSISLPLSNTEGVVLWCVPKDVPFGRFLFCFSLPLAPLRDYENQSRSPPRPAMGPR